MTYSEAVQTLAAWHRASPQPPERIFWFPDPQSAEIRLIEVTSSVADAGELYPIRFGATAELPFATVVAEVTLDEWRAIEVGRMDLPNGWSLAGKQEV